MLISLIVLTGIAQAASTASNFKVTPIPSNHAIYFDEAGKLQLMHDEWTLLIYYNLTSYWQASDKINMYVNQPLWILWILCAKEYRTSICRVKQSSINYVMDCGTLPNIIPSYSLNIQDRNEATLMGLEN